MARKSIFSKKICLISTLFANPIPDPLMVGREDAGLAGHEGDRMNKVEVVDKSTLTMLMKLFQLTRWLRKVVADKKERVMAMNTRMNFFSLF